MGRRVAVWLAIAVGLAAAAAVWFVAFSLDARVARALERHASAALGTPVRVGGVDLDLRGGRGVVHALRVANPEGFSSAPAVEVAKVELAIALASLRADPIVLELARIEAPLVRVELDARGRSNVEALRDRARGAAAAEGAAATAPPPADTGAQAGSAPRLLVRRLETTEGAIRLDASALGGAPQEVRLRALSLDDVGGPAGATPERIAREVGDALLRRTLRAVAAAQTKRKLGELGGRLGEKLGEAIGRGIEAAP